MAHPFDFGPRAAEQATSSPEARGDLILAAASEYLLAPLLDRIAGIGPQVIPFEGSSAHLLELAAGWRTAIVAEWERLAPAARELHQRPAGRLLVISFVPWWSEDEEAAARACDVIVHDTAEPEELSSAAETLRRFFGATAA